MTEVKHTKASNFCDIDDEGSDSEVWILQCPKSFDPRKMIGRELGKMGNDEPKLEYASEKFNEKKILTVITPEKLAEYEMVCDKVKLVKPIGKIVVCEKGSKNCPPPPCPAVPSNASQIAQNDYDSDEQPNEDKFSSDSEVKTITSKKTKKKLNEQRLTIETVVTVEPCKKKTKKSKNIKEEPVDCLPHVPESPCPLKKKKKSKNDHDLSWMC